MKKIVAIGGHGGQGRGFERSSKIDREIIKLSGKKKPKVLFIPTATDDSKKYIKKFLKRYQKELKCDCEALLLWNKKISNQEIENKIMNADIIYVGGGNTLKMVNRWKKLKVDEFLKRAYQKGTVMCGVSAGSICWFASGVSDSRQFKNPKSHEYIRVNGLGFMNFLHCPHYKSKIDDKGHRTKGLEKILKKNEICIAIEDQCAIEFRENKFRIITARKNAKAYKVFYKNGKIVEEEFK